MLLLADWAGSTEADIFAEIEAPQYNWKTGTSGWEAGKGATDGIAILIAYKSVGSWGCDSNAWLLLRRTDGAMLEVHGSHCSCYGFEGQWSPEETTAAYLLSDKFAFYTGGYDDHYEANQAAVKAEIARLFGGDQ